MEFNTSNSLKSDLFAAIFAPLAISPAISIIDKAIFTNASGKETLFKGIYNGIKSLGNPISFIKQPSFIWIYGVYSGTYLVANFSETAMKKFDIKGDFSRFAAISTTNRYFTKAFGKELSVKPVPFLSSATYTSRDLLTIYASFNLPPKLAPHIERLGFTYGSAQNIAQLITPISMQIVSTPLPLLGMNYYNSPNATLKERLLFIRKEYFNTVIARMMRIGVAYGFGQILNKSIKKKLNSYFR